MKLIYTLIADMANNRKISDKNFRMAIQRLFSRDRDSGVSFNDQARELSQEAVYETERDLYVH